MKTKTILRGEVYAMDTGKAVGSVQGGYRPVVVIQNNLGNIHSDTVIVALVTSKRKTVQPTHFTVQLEKESTVMCEQVQTVPREHLRNKLYYLSGEEMAKLDQSLRSSLGLT